MSFCKMEHSTLRQQKFSSYFSWEKAIIFCRNWTQRPRVFIKCYRVCKEYIRSGTEFWSYTDPSPAAQWPLADPEYPFIFFQRRNIHFPNHQEQEEKKIIIVSPHRSNQEPSTNPLVLVETGQRCHLIKYCNNPVIKWLHDMVTVYTLQ